MPYTTTELIAKIKLWAAVPNSQPAFTETQILDLATDELWTRTVPYINQLREEYFVVTVDKDITTAKNQSFDIPSRAAGGLLRDVKLVNSEGNETDVPRISPEYTQRYSWGFYLQGNKIYLIKSENYSRETLRLYYYVRPSQLVLTSKCAQVTSVSATTFEVSSIPTNLTSGDTVDIIQATPPFNTLSLSITATWVDTTVTPSTMPTGLAVGDWMCTKEESCIPQIQLEAQSLLICGTVIRIQEILQDDKSIKTYKAKFEEFSETVGNILSPRVVGEIEKINNEESLLSFRRSGSNYRYR